MPLEKCRFTRWIKNKSMLNFNCWTALFFIAINSAATNAYYLNNVSNTRKPISTLSYCEVTPHITKPANRSWFFFNNRARLWSNTSRKWSNFFIKTKPKNAMENPFWSIFFSKWILLINRKIRIYKVLLLKLYFKATVDFFYL